MVRRFVFASVLVATVTQIGLAQDPPQAQQLEARLRNIEQRLDDQEAAHQALEDAVTAQLAAQQKLLEDMQQLAENTLHLQQNQKRLLDEIAAWDSEDQTQAHLRMDNVMRSETGREQVREAVHDSMQRTGTLMLTNKTSTGQGVTINNRDYVWIPAGSPPVQVSVPVGSVSVQIQGREMTTWTITAPGYRQDLDIVPTYNSGSVWVWDSYLGAWVRR